MTVSDLIQHFGDGDLFPNPKQEVKFVLCPDGATPSVVKLDIRATTVPEEGDAVVELKPAKMQKYRFSLRFEAIPIIEAHTLEEAEKKASEMMRGVAVTEVDWEDGEHYVKDDYVAQEPCFLEEVEE